MRLLLLLPNGNVPAVRYRSISGLGYMTTPEIDNCMEVLRWIIKANAKVDPRHSMCRLCVQVYTRHGITGESPDCIGIQEGPSNEDT